MAVSDLAGLRGAEPDWGPSSLSLTSLREVLGAAPPEHTSLTFAWCVWGGGALEQEGGVSRCDRERKKKRKDALREKGAI